MDAAFPPFLASAFVFGFGVLPILDANAGDWYKVAGVWYDSGGDKHNNAGDGWDPDKFGTELEGVSTSSNVKNDLLNFLSGRMGCDVLIGFGSTLGSRLELAGVPPLSDFR